MKKYSVFILRGAPPHFGHLKIISEALKVTDELIIILGSHNKAENIRDPFNSIERIEMLKIGIQDMNLDVDKVHFIPVEDSVYNIQKWISNIQSAVHGAIWAKWSPDPCEISLIGHSKDHSSFYLKLFPNWNSIEIEDYRGLNSTDIRNDLFRGKLSNIKEKTTDGIVSYLKKWIETDKFYDLYDEFVIIDKYKKEWSKTPYPVIFNTVDSCVVQAGHVLLVQRRALPGKGLWALPGGFIGEFETLENAMIRELKEETKIDVPEKVLLGSISKRKTFDDPHRSVRGRVITTAFRINLQGNAKNYKLPKVKGSDDAVKAKWFEISNIKRNMMFEDHMDIIQDLIEI